MLLKQMWNRKRSNTWMAIELLLVFCITWYLIDFIYVYNYNCRIKNYRNVQHTWRINVAILPDTHPDFREEENEPETLFANYTRILQMIQTYPGVESVGISYSGASPGNGSYWGMGLRSLEDTTRVSQGQKIPIDVQYDFLQVFGYSQGKGEKAVSTRDFDWNSANGIVISRSVEQELFPDGLAIGKEVSHSHNSNERYTVIGVVDNVKRFYYERPQNTFYIPERLSASNVGYAEISIRSNALLSDTKFREQFKKDMSSKLRIGNCYFLSITSYEKIEKNTATMFGAVDNVRFRLYLMLFFILNVFLCVMGTFWYRINQRTNEIGLRKAIGSTEIGIQTTLLMEGVFLLLIIAIPAMLIEYQFVHADMIETLGRREINKLYLPDRTFARFAISNLITFVCMLIVVILAAWIPARRGAKMAAADALHYE